MRIDNAPITDPKFGALLWLLMFLCVTAVNAHGFTGDVAAVDSGDTLVVVAGGERHNVRLYGVDAPVSGQQGAVAARRYLHSLALAHPVEVAVLSTDVFNRVVAIVSRVQKESSINAAVVANGYAWVNPNSCQADVCQTWHNLQHQAKKYRLGIWSGFDLTPPWEFTQQQRR